LVAEGWGVLDAAGEGAVVALGFGDLVTDFEGDGLGLVAGSTPHRTVGVGR
jgi:hypothetical protein